LSILLVDLLCAAVLVPDQGCLAQRVTRLLLVLSLVRWRLGGHQADSAQVIKEQLRSQVPLLPSPPFPKVLPADRIELVRRATVSDLFVVRSEWRCYVAGEIA